MKKYLLTLVLLGCIIQLFAQKNIYFKTTNAKSITVKLNNDPGEFPFDDLPNPFELGLPKNSKLDFILPNDSLKITLQEKVIVNIYRADKADTIRLHFNPVEIITFDDNFKKRHAGKTNVEVPEVYELMNILIAISPTGMADKNLVYTSSDYYKKVVSHFAKYQNEKAVLSIEALLKQDNYYNLKMDSYAFLYDKNGRIVPHPNYHVINWSNINSISPDLLEEMNDFAKKSGFRKFYQSSRKVYSEQTKFYQKEVNFDQMVSWLRKHFPSTKYNYYNVIFSPLVYGNQSTQQFEDNDFKEAQLHVNFPYYNPAMAKKFKHSYNLFRGNILFTELNHNFINPEAEKYAARIKLVLSDLPKWEESGKAAQFGYANPMACFEEYMNWGLVLLYMNDYAAPQDLPKMIDEINNTMTSYRGFSKFDVFGKHLLDLYRNRKNNVTVADLYPQIIDWFERYEN